MNISGVYCGIGSVLIPAKKYNFEIGNCFEDRIEFKKFNPLELYFNVKLYNDFKKFNDETKEIDILISQPKCGMFSSYMTNVIHDCTTHPHLGNLFKTVNKYKPLFFAFENLPKLLELYNIESLYKNTENQYDIFPEYITNCGYGNVQYRRRLWLIGARKDLEYTFRANEYRPIITVKDIIGDLLSEESYQKFTNHHKINLNTRVKFMRNVTSIDDEPFKYTKEFNWNDFKKYKFNPGLEKRKIFKYTNSSGITYRKMFIRPIYWDRYSQSLVGNDGTPLHPIRFEPLSIRERLRIQGLPDDYKFEGIRLNDKKEMDPNKAFIFYRMTSRCIPVNFVDYLLSEFYIHIENKKQEERSTNRLYQNEIIQHAKYYGCEKKLLTHSKYNCLHCELNKICSRSI